MTIWQVFRKTRHPWSSHQEDCHGVQTCTRRNSEVQDCVSKCPHSSTLPYFLSAETEFPMGLQVTCMCVSGASWQSLRKHQSIRAEIDTKGLHKKDNKTQWEMEKMNQRHEWWLDKDQNIVLLSKEVRHLSFSVVAQMNVQQVTHMLKSHWFILYCSKCQ